jgi:purine nucleosidase
MCRFRIMCGDVGARENARVRVHLDTDIGTDPDDACALAMLLGWPDVEVVGLTTTVDPGGRRAGYAAYCLGLLGRDDVPVVAGASQALTRDAPPPRAVDDATMWPSGIAARPSPAGAATDQLLRSVELGATVIAIGPYTNLALLERARPGSLARVPVVLMGGWVRPPTSGLPRWGPDRDWNMQADSEAARAVVEACSDLTLSTLPASLQVPMRARDLPALRALGPMGELLARQSEAHAVASGKSDLGPAHSGLPDDLVNLHYDPLACAVALGWPGAVVEHMRLRAALHQPGLHLYAHPDGHAVRVVVGADGEAFTRAWLQAVRTACERAR